MNIFRNLIGCTFLFGGLIVGLSMLHAQETPFQSQSINDIDAILQAIEATTPLPAESATNGSNFYSAQHSPTSAEPWPPLPGDVLGLNVWPLGDGVFLLDDRDLDYSALSAGRMQAMSMDPNDPGDGDTNGYAPNFLPAFTPTTNDLWLEITGTTNYGTNLTVYLVIHPPWNVTNGVFDLYYRTNLNLDPTSTFSLQWSRIARTSPAQTYLVVTNLPPNQGFFRIGPLTNAIRPGFNQQFLATNDDNCSGGINGDNNGYGTLLPNLLAPLPFTISFFGTNYSQLYVNNNGNVTFDTNYDTFLPESLDMLGTKIIAPFWADVDTRNPGSDVVRYGTNVVDGHKAFGVEWVNVGYYVDTYGGADKLLSCQLVIIDRSDIAANDFDMEFNYDKVQWGWGNFSIGTPPRAGYSDGGINFYELPGSGADGPGSEPGVEGAFLDYNFDTGLIYCSMDGPRTNLLTGPISGRYRFYFRNGVALP